MQNLFPSAKEKPRNWPLHGKNPTYQAGYCLGTQVPKKTQVLWLNTPMGKSNLQRLSFHPWKNRFLSSYWTIIIWQFKIVLLLPKWYLSCVLCLESSAKLSRCHVRAGRIRRKSYYWVLSLSFPSQNLLYSFRIQKARGTTKCTPSPPPLKGAPTWAARAVSRLENRWGLHKSTNQKLKGKEVGRTRASERRFLQNSFMNLPPKLRFKETVSSFLTFSISNEQSEKERVFCEVSQYGIFPASIKTSYNSLWNSLVEKGKFKVHSWLNGLRPKWW